MPSSFRDSIKKRKPRAIDPAEEIRLLQAAKNGTLTYADTGQAEWLSLAYQGLVRGVNITPQGNEYLRQALKGEPQ